MLTGCGSSDTTETTAPTEASDDGAAASDETDAADAAEDVTDAAQEVGDLSDANVAVFYYTYSDTYIASVRTALDAQLDSLGVTYQDYDANSNQTTQNEQISTPRFRLEQPC